MNSVNNKKTRKSPEQLAAGGPCGANKKSGGQCALPGTGSGGRCRYHGGATPVGIASSRYTHGLNSRNLPSRLASRYQEALADPDLLSSRQDIALLETRLEEVLQRLDSTESGELWESLREAFVRYDRAVAQARNNPASRARVEAWEEIRRLVNEGFADQQNWREVRAILQEHRALKESERKRLVDSQQMISVAQANLLLGAVAHIVKTHVADPASLKAIAVELGRLVSVEPGASPGPFAGA